MKPPRRKNAVRVNAMAVAEMIKGIQDGCHTLYELSDMSGLSIQTVRHYCNVLHKARVIHVCDWREDAKGGKTLRVFSMGYGDDAKKPKPMSSRDACARYRARKKHERLLQRMAG